MTLTQRGTLDVANSVAVYSSKVSIQRLSVVSVWSLDNVWFETDYGKKVNCFHLIITRLVLEVILTVRWTHTRPHNSAWSIWCRNCFTITFIPLRILLFYMQCAQGVTTFDGLTSFKFTVVHQPGPFINLMSALQFSMVLNFFLSFSLAFKNTTKRPNFNLESKCIMV